MVMAPENLGSTMEIDQITFTGVAESNLRPLSADKARLGCGTHRGNDHFRTSRGDALIRRADRELPALKGGASTLRDGSPRRAYLA